MVHKLYYWLPAVACMVLIFALSSRQSFAVSDEFTFNFIIFKTLHMIEYAVLYILLFRAFLSGKKASKTDSMKKAFIFAVIYAVSDEIHQTFVPTREGTVRDVIIDAAGISIMYMIVKKYFSRMYNYLQ